MNQQILDNLNNPAALESLYRKDREAFSSAFHSLYSEISASPAAEFWYQRLNAETKPVYNITSKEVLFFAVSAFLAGLIAKIPDFAGIEQDYFYSRNIGLIFLPFLTAFFVWKKGFSLRKILGIMAAFAIPGLYLNLLPDNPESHTLVLACLHIPLFLWAVLGFAFSGGFSVPSENRIAYLRYNGELLVMTTILLIAGGLLSGITIGLFSLIDLNIEAVYMKWVGVWGLSSAPILGTFLLRVYPHLVQQVSPVIAKVFSPLVLLMLTVYLGAVIVTGKDPYNDREFLILFNLVLVGVMALIVFAISELSKSPVNKSWLALLTSLALVTLILNAIALSAILFRISEWGITPNRMAVLGSNILIMTHLVLVTKSLLDVIRAKCEVNFITLRISQYLPIYGLWAFFVAVAFPLLFSFK
jgi:hypothetical protein